MGKKHVLDKDMWLSTGTGPPNLTPSVFMQRRINTYEQLIKLNPESNRPRSICDPSGCLGKKAIHEWLAGGWLEVADRGKLVCTWNWKVWLKPGREAVSLQSNSCAFLNIFTFTLKALDVYLFCTNSSLTIAWPVVGECLETGQHLPCKLWATTAISANLMGIHVFPKQPEAVRKSQNGF